MAKNVIAIDVGLHSLKAVCVSGSGSSASLSRAAIVPQTAMSQSIQQASEKSVAAQLKDLTGQLKGGGECHFAFNSPSAILRYVETPYYPQSDLRASLKLNHQTYLRQNFENYTFDGVCLFQGAESARKEKDVKADADKQTKKGKTLIAGLPTTEVLIFYMAAKRAGLQPKSLTLAPLSVINGYECGSPDSFHQEAVLLLDIGHLSSSLTIVHQEAVFLTRIINLGGKNVLDHLIQTQGSAGGAEDAQRQGGEALGQAIQASLGPMMREVHSSVNFFERNTETDLKKIILSGRLARAPVTAEVIQKEVGFTCEAWNATQGIKNSLPADQRELFAENETAFAVAMGTARAALS
jgi:Tfp pilus assembly PilM family ATPase